MKRIEYMAPVSAMRGKLSEGKQKLMYSPEDRTYFERDEKKYAAQNYRTSFVGALVSGTGTTYFATKKRNIIRPTQKNKTVAAAFKAAQQAKAAVLKDITSLAAFVEDYRLHNGGEYKTIPGYIAAKFFTMFYTKVKQLDLHLTESVESFNNPYVPGGSGTVVVKEDPELARFLK